MRVSLRRSPFDLKFSTALQLARSPPAAGDRTQSVAGFGNRRDEDVREEEFPNGVERVVGCVVRPHSHRHDRTGDRSDRLFGLPSASRSRRDAGEARRPGRSAPRRGRSLPAGSSAITSLRVAVHDAVLAYWRYVAAQERLRTYVESAERAQRLVRETEVLIRADERPASDLDLVAGNRAQKQTVVTAARQTLLDAKYVLGIAMGLGAGAVRTLGAPLTAFPATAFDCSGFETETRAAAVRSALRERRDLAALRARRDGARLAWEGALRDVRSRWDVVTRFGHTRVGGRAGSEAGISFAAGAAGLNGLVQVQYEPVATNRAARGRAMVGAASHRASVAAVDDLARRIEASVLVAIEALDNAVQEALAAEEAVRLSGRTVLTEQEKFRLGLATLFDAILAEDSLTNARLQRTTARLRFAAALLRLRFETGTLLDLAAGAVSVDAIRIASFGVEECRP